MFLIRLLGGLFALALTYIMSIVTGIPAMNLMTIMAFILVVDVQVLQWISYIYMKDVLKQMEQTEEHIKRDDDGSNSGS